MTYNFLLSYKLKEGVNKEYFKKSMELIVKDFYKIQDGFISINMGYNEKENIFYEIHVWKSKLFTDDIHKKFMENDICAEQFGNIDLTSMTMTELNFI